MAGAELLHVEVVYARPDGQSCVNLDLPAGLSVRDAIRESGLLKCFPEIDLTINKVGVYGRLRNLDDPLADGDRVEIYRSLTASPKEARRRRARTGE
ncbi:MAG TPA: RnfH family protein [Gammaproteobacteria bacterium]|nr:RnfH family protein [Gammaproteobacteria bacterium]